MIKKPQASTILVLNEKQQLLVHLRVNCRAFNGLYATPGGSVEPRETALDAAQRELEEEAGLGLPLERFEYWGQAVMMSEAGEPFDLHYWCVYLRDREVPKYQEPEMHSDWEWWDALRVLSMAHRLIPSLILPGKLERYLDIAGGRNETGGSMVSLGRAQNGGA